MNEDTQATTPEQIETPAAEPAETTPEFDLALDPPSEPEVENDGADEEEAEANDPTPDDGQPDAGEDWLEAGLDQDEDDSTDDEGDNAGFMTDFTIPELDDDALTNRTRWGQQWQGLHKLQKRVNEQAERFSGYAQLDQALATPEGAKEVIARLTEAAKSAYPDHFAEQEAPQRENNWMEGDDYSATSLWDTYEEPKPQAPAVDKASILNALGIDEGTLSEIVQERTRAREEARLVQQAEASLAGVNARLQGLAPGFSVTSEELLIAMKKRPNLPPEEAVVLAHTAKLKRTVAENVRGGKPQPTMPKGAKRAGVSEANDLNSIIGKFQL